MGLPYERIEEDGVMIPVLEAGAKYISMARFDELVEIEPVIASYNGIKLEMKYQVRNQKTGELRCTGSTQHCFLDKEGKPLFLKRSHPQWHELLSLCAKTHAIENV
jgi:acyl-CoA thioester hydrolase